MAEKDKISTIKLRELTKERVHKLKEYKNESYDEIINKILDILNACKSDPERARKILYKINIKRLKLKRTGHYTDQELKQKFNL
jgi:hypothetical protein